MNTANTLQVEMPFPLVSINPFLLTQTQDKPIRLEKSPVFSINNYLKTPEEIDAELCSEMNMDDQSLFDYKDGMDSYGRPFKNRSDNAYSPDNIPSGFMEENY